MSEKEKKIIETLGKKINQMSEFQKGYILGMAESKAEEKANDSKRGSKEA